MQAIVMHETGSPNVLRREEVVRPEPGAGEVLIRVHAASVNPVDWKYRRGHVDRQLPAILGNDVSGTVELSRAAGFAEGDPVFGIAASGGYAELASAAGDAIAHKPAGLSHQHAAAIPVSGLTAWQALFDRGRLESGQTALIAGGAGGVGHLAVQFAKRAGARVIATGSSRNRDFVLGLGADRYVDYTREDVAAAVSGADLALDTVGGATTRSLLAVVPAGGTLISITYPTPSDWHATAGLAARAGVRAQLVVMGPQPAQLARIAELVAAGDARVEIAAALPLSDVRRAHQLSESGHTRGKIVLSIGN